jgi:long-chain acyl-CoA synthetase
VGFTLAGVIRHWAERTPERPMLTYLDATSTWAEQHRRSSQIAQALLAEGVGAGDRIAILDKNSVAFFEVAFGSAKINAVPVPVNWRLAPVEMAEIINDAEAPVLVVDPSFAGQLAAFEGALTTVRRIVVLGTDASAHVGYEDWLGGHLGDDPGIEPAAGDVALQLYTSGTTGLPKGVMLTNANIEANLAAAGREMEIDADTVNMAAMPLFHVGGSGWAFLGLAHGAHTVIMREVEPLAFLRAFERHRISHTFVVPAVIMMLLATPETAGTDFSALRYLTYGASPISERVLGQAIDVFASSFVQLYGMTETTGAITLLRPEDHEPDGEHLGRLRSCGVPFDGVELRVVDLATGADAPTGSPGELWTRSAGNMKGYWHNPSATASTITADGWLKTGDVAYVDADGYYYLHDRVKDMIVTGGENVYPAEVENALMSHPGVADCAVIGVPDEQWGETVKAIVVAAPGAAPAPEELIAFARSKIAGYKVPRSIDFVAVLPRNPSGKVIKRELRAPFWAGMDRQIH